MAKKEKIVLIGAGFLQFGLWSADSILNSEVLEGATISLHDINPTTLDLAFQALLLDPTIDKASNARDIFEEMLKINQDYINIE